MRVRILAAAVLVGCSSLASAQLPSGGEFLVNTFLPSEQKMSSVAIGPRGDFMIVWNSVNQDGSGFGVFARRYNALGQPQGVEFQVNTANTNLQYVTDGAIAADRSGNYMVVWTSSAPGQDGSGRGIMGRIFNPQGVPVTAEFPVNTFTAGAQNRASVAALPGGEFVAVWDSNLQDGSGEAAIGRKFDSAGRPLTGEFLINVFTPSRQYQPRVDADAAGNFTVVWMSYTQDGSDWGIVGRRFNAAAAPLSGEFGISSVTNLSQTYPTLSVVPDGRFAVVWEDQTRDNSRFGAFARRFDAAGNPFGPEYQMNVYTTDHQHRPTVAAYGNGSFLAAWYSQDQLGFNNQDVFARQVDAAGTPGPEFLVNAQTQFQGQFLSAADADETGNIVVSWTALTNAAPPNPPEYDVYARRYGGLLAWALNVDASPVPGASNGNRVFEPGETVIAGPSWRNVFGGALGFDGAASQFIGPGAAVYSIADNAAGYGSVPHDTVRQCGPGAGCYLLAVSGARPLQHWDAQFREDLVPALVGQSKAWAVHIGDSFADIPRSNGYYRFVETVLHRGVIGACSPTQYCPAVTVSRDRMAQYVLKSKDPYWVPTACIAGQEMFADVPAASPFCRWVEELARRGVVAGCGGGNYCPSAGVTREQLAVYLLLTLEGNTYLPPACGAPLFNDMPASNPFCRWVEELARRGVVGGCGGGAYCPLVPVPRDQMSVFLTVTFGLTLYGP